MRTSALLALLATGIGVRAAAGQEPLPAPPPVFYAPSYLPPPIHRIDRYAVWQNYAVDRQGFFRPRVIDTPYGAFYAADGRPYPFLHVHPVDFMPYASD